MAQNITWHAGLSREERCELRGQRGLTIWHVRRHSRLRQPLTDNRRFTGLSASGKSTIAAALEQHLLHLGFAAYLLDGDNVRFGLNKDLGFSPADRTENIRRVAEVAKLFADNATVAIASFISPYRADRAAARRIHEQGGPLPGDKAGLPFVEVWVDVPLAVAEERDPKGLYQKARAGKIPEFTGISAPYEEPEKPDLRIKSHECTVEEAVQMVMDLLEVRQLLKKGSDKQVDI